MDNRGAAIAGGWELRELNLRFGAGRRRCLTSCQEHKTRDQQGANHGSDGKLPVRPHTELDFSRTIPIAGPNHLAEQQASGVRVDVAPVGSIESIEALHSKLDAKVFIGVKTLLQRKVIIQFPGPTKL